MAKKKLEMENNSCSNGAKLPELTDDHAVQQNGNRLGAVRKHFQDTNGRETDIRLRERISNLKPSTVGYKTALKRQELGQTKLVVYSHKDEIILSASH